jgi:hypothetical protein
MKTIRQLVLFLLGVSLGACLLFLVRLRLHTADRQATSPVQVAENLQNHAVTPPRVHRSGRPRRKARSRIHSSRHGRVANSEVAEVRTPVRPRRRKAKAHGFALERTTTLARAQQVLPAPRVESAPSLAQVIPAPQAPPPPTLFKTIGYVEKADGQLEAIIMQDEQVQVVHLGDRIADRYRVTSISPNTVAAIDDTTSEVAMAKPGRAPGFVGFDVLIADASASEPRPAPTSSRREIADAYFPARARAASSLARRDSVALISSYEHAEKSLGYVKKYDGDVEVVMTDGDSVRLVPAKHSETIAQAIPASGPREATQAAPAPSTQGSRTPLTVASSAVGDSTIPSGPALNGAVFRQVAYKTQAVAGNGVTSSQDMLPAEGGRPVSGSARGVTISPLLDKARSSRPTGKYWLELSPLGLGLKSDPEK